MKKDLVINFLIASVFIGLVACVTGAFTSQSFCNEKFTSPEVRDCDSSG